ncbi:MAG: CopG family transcriptional regulator [Candidatus Aenigmatarchaeota archaeon]
MAEVEVDDETYEKIKIRAKKKGFDSADIYIKKILEKVASKVDEEEEEKVKSRLRSLGYMD